MEPSLLTKIERPTFGEIYMQFASAIAERSTCSRTNSAGERMKVGAVITSVDFKQVYSVGYNGNATGLPNQCDSTEPGQCGCVHAEENAAVKAPPGIPKLVFCTHLPCVRCGKLLINLGGVQAVYYKNDYRIRDSLLNFERVGIRHAQMVTTTVFPPCKHCGGQH